MEAAIKILASISDQEMGMGVEIGNFLNYIRMTVREGLGWLLQYSQPILAILNVRNFRVSILPQRQWNLCAKKRGFASHSSLSVILSNR